MPTRTAFVAAVVALLVATPAAARRAAFPSQTKKQAEVRVLHVVATRWNVWRLPGLFDPKTHLLANNTEAVCHGRGGRQGENRYRRFVCVVRPHEHIGRQGLYLRYDVLSKRRVRVKLIAARRR